MNLHSALVSLLIATGGLPLSATEAPRARPSAAERGAIFAECGRLARLILHGWLETKQDATTHLYSRGKVWDYHNEAADHYSSLVLIAHYVEPALNEPGGALHRTLRSMAKLCATPSGLPAKYDLRTHRPAGPATFPELAEWLRDGLIRINELLGTGSDWYRETERLVDAMIAEAKRRGGLHAALQNDEARGCMLQTLARLYVMSDRAAYLEAAEALGDAVLLSGHPFTSDLLVFNDHGCELVPGLAELFAVERQLGRPRGESYRAPLITILDALMASGAHPVSGLFTNPASAAKKQQQRPQPPDTWGYVLFAYENYERATGDRRYRARVEKPLRWLLENRPRFPELAGSLWPRAKVSDDWSDSYESMIVLWNRYQEVGDGFAWLDWATRQHIHRRMENPTYGPFTGGHFDGSVGRTLCLHMMLCAQGVRAAPFAADLELGAQRAGDDVLLSLKAGRDWQGRLVFDGPRSRHLAGTLDWARINEMPQWFVARPEAHYQVRIDGGAARIVSGRELLAGLPLAVTAATRREILVAPVRSP